MPGLILLWMFNQTKLVSGFRRCAVGAAARSSLVRARPIRGAVEAGAQLRLSSELRPRDFASLELGAVLRAGAVHVAAGLDDNRCESKVHFALSRKRLNLEISLPKPSEVDE